MRLNLPVSQHNYDYPADELLVSSTNLKGEIIHCNDAFQRVSGFDMDELIDKECNILVLQSKSKAGVTYSNVERVFCT